MKKNYRGFGFYIVLILVVIDRVVEEIGVLPTIVATGDSAGVIVPHCKHTVLVDDELALKGLKIIYDKNVEENTHRQKGGCSC